MMNSFEMENAVTPRMVTKRSKSSIAMAAARNDDENENVHPNMLAVHAAGSADIVKNNLPSSSSSVTKTKQKQTPLLVMTPDAKRHKTATSTTPTRHTTPSKSTRKEATKEVDIAHTISIDLDYPSASEIAVPSRRLVASFYQQALEMEATTATTTTTVGDQVYLQPAGVLSVEQVLLPCLAKQEDKALKVLQAKVQRDAPQHTHIYQQSRQMVYQGIGVAIGHVKQARLDRQAQAMECRLQETHQRALIQQQRLEQEQQEHARQRCLEQQAHDLEQSNRLKVLKRQHPRNQSLWREVVQLMTAKSKLEKEERLWQQAERQLIEQEEQAAAQDEDATIISTSTIEEQQQVHQEEIEISKDDLYLQLEQLVQDMSISTTRIQEGLGLVNKSVNDSDQMRKQLYQSYRQDHQFHGYQGVSNPRGLIRFLSQSQQEQSSQEE